MMPEIDLRKCVVMIDENPDVAEDDWERIQKLPLNAGCIVRVGPCCEGRSLRDLLRDPGDGDA